MSPLKRYRALNDQIFRLRGGKPIHLRIDGPEPLDLLHDDVMLEAAATSFQIHLKVSVAECGGGLQRLQNVVGAAGGGGRQLALSVRPCALAGDAHSAFRAGGGRRGLGLRPARGIRARLCERIPAAVLRGQPGLFPCVCCPADRHARRGMAHLRLHNGTIWRWNRPLIGFDRTAGRICVSSIG